MLNKFISISAAIMHTWQYSIAFLNGNTTNAGVRSIFTQYKYISMQMSPDISGVTRQKFTKFLDDVTIFAVNAHS